MIEETNGNPPANNDQNNPPRRKPRNLNDLAALLGGSQEPEQPRPPQEKIPTPSSQEETGLSKVPSLEDHTAPLPKELQSYLSPDLWRKLNGVEVRRGVLINALDQIRSILFLLSTYLPAHLVQEKMGHPVPGIVKGQMISGSLLFSDVSGFTALSEKLEALGPRGAERMTHLMNEYFTTMLEILSWSGGILIKFAGDAMLVYFPYQENNLQCEWAVRAGLRMLRAMPTFSNISTPSGPVSLKMKIGIASGEFLAASVGDAQRMEYVILGEPVTRTMTAESYAVAGQLLADQFTVDNLNPKFISREVKKGYFLTDYPLEELDDFELRAERRRARGAVAWSASPQAIVVQLDIAIKQIEAIKPFLAHELSDRVIANVRQRRFDSEFRPTTVMFCNFTGLEQLLQMLGREAPQRVTGLLNAFFIAMNEIIARFGGVVSRIDPYKNGSKMLVLFGAPVTHEDDPQRAANAALAMQAELGALNQRWQQRLARFLPANLVNAPLIQLGIGITQGTTFAGLVGSSSRREYTVMGDQVNLAARLMGASEPGQVLISQDVYKDISSDFITTVLAPIKVKGKTNPIPIFEVESLRLDVLLNRVKMRPPLISREQEVAQCLKVMEKALLNRSPQILWITGQAGSGKSHLADSVILTALELNAKALLFQSHSYLSEVPYSAWASLLKTMCNITPLDSPIIQQRKFTEFLGEAGIGYQQSQHIASLTGIKLPDSFMDQTKDQVPVGIDKQEILKASQKWTRRNSGSGLWDQIGADSPPANSGKFSNNLYLTGICAALKHISAHNPVVFLFEDADDLDSASLNLLPALINELGEAGILFIILLRDEDRPDICERSLVRLKPFDQIGTKALMSHILLSELAPVIQEQTGGNPLLIEQITRWIQRTRKINSQDLISVLRSSDILQKLILSGLETLHENLREVARAASVIGYEFRMGELKALQPHADSLTLSGYIHELVKNQVFSMRESGVDPQYAFVQSLTRDVLYNSIPDERRRDYHANLAEYLLNNTDIRKVQTRLATFLGSQQSLAPSQIFLSIALNYQHAEAWSLAAQQYYRAAQEFAKVNAQEKAVSCCQSALSMLDRLVAEEPDQTNSILRSSILVAIGILSFKSGDQLHAIASLESGLALLSDTEPTYEYTRTATNLAVLLSSQNRLTESEQILRKLRDISGIPFLKATVALAWIFNQQNNPEIIPTINKALEIEELQPSPLIRALLKDLGGFLEEASQEYQSNQMPLGTAVILLRQSQNALLAREPQISLRFVQDAMEIFRSLDNCPAGMAMAHYQQAQIAWKTGNIDLCRSEILLSREFLEQSSGKIQKEGREATRKALKVIENLKSTNWPEWSLKELENKLYQTILFDTEF